MTLRDSSIREELTNLLINEITTGNALIDNTLLHTIAYLCFMFVQKVCCIL